MRYYVQTRLGTRFFLIERALRSNALRHAPLKLNVARPSSGVIDVRIAELIPPAANRRLRLIMTGDGHATSSGGKVSFIMNRHGLAEPENRSFETWTIRDVLTADVCSEAIYRWIVSACQLAQYPPKNGLTTNYGSETSTGIIAQSFVYHEPARRRRAGGALLL